MQQIIPINHKFCCIALSGVPDLNINFPCDILPNLSIYSANPFELDNHWIEWLGSLEIDHLKNCNFLILSSALSEKPKVLDHENESINISHAQKTSSFFGMLKILIFIIVCYFIFTSHIRS